MNTLLSKNFFWTCLSFLTFGLFIFAITSKNYWINIFVILLGLQIRKRGSDALITYKHISTKKTIIRKDDM